ncbi:MAG: hypothetical protein VCD31_08215, partial [Alphaproteobacteria bacterium]
GANLDEAISIILLSFKPITQSDARAFLDALEILKSVSGTTPATLSLKEGACLSCVGGLWKCGGGLWRLTKRNAARGRGAPANDRGDAARE